MSAFALKADISAR